jgi:hypothetical protein
MPDLDPQEYEALERAELLGNGGAIWRAARNYYRAALAAREEPQTDGVAAWADHANRIADAERVIDGAAYVPAIEAYCVVRDLQAMQGDGVLYSPQERDGVFRWAAAREDTERRDPALAIVGGLLRVVRGKVSESDAATDIEAAERFLAGEETGRPKVER